MCSRFRTIPSIPALPTAVDVQFSWTLKHVGSSILLKDQKVHHMHKHPIWVHHVLLLLSICLGISFALTEGEKTTILDLYKSWPGLDHLSPPWSLNASKACETPAFQGLECSEGPDNHILGLYVSNHICCFVNLLDANSMCLNATM